VLEHLGGALGAQRDQQHRRLAPALDGGTTDLLRGGRRGGGDLLEFG
jgi:hypothetical protein